ncbi:extracellular solute-binding protein [Microbacterium sp. zg.Y1084]|uniref:extracellular solute-binding protein n=1 Tax=Microbacterium sp. zg.Y1084 TaxID=2969667 RepID=UPI00214CB1D3|nr:extracellular solute-binding protein [Microbacterium sp. zg.Y1084]MCR2813904.1 extracellular solute-binding protein [Microbacterium sp. zg.Y1084]
MAIGAMIASTVLLAGCSAGSSGSGGDQGSGEGTVKLVSWPGPEGEAMIKVVDAYNAEQGKEDGVNVELTMLSRQDTFSKESALMASKSSDVDIYFTASYNIGQFAPSLDPLTDIDTSSYFPVAAEGLTYEGELYALPLDVSNHFLLYRKDLTDALLVDPTAQAAYERISESVLGESRAPKDPNEWDLDDFKVAAAYFSQSENPSSPTKYGTVIQAKNLLYNTMIWNDVLWGYGGNWVDDGQAALTSDAAKKAVQLYSDIYTNGWTSPDSSQAEFPETQAALQSGNTAFAIQWSAAFASLNDPAQSPDVAGKIAIAPVPGGKTHVHALAVSLNKYSENKAAAKKFLSFLATEDAMTQYAQAGGIPAVPAVLEANGDLNPAFTLVSETITENGYSVPVFPQTFQGYSKIAEDLSGAWVGQVDIDSALETANANLQELLG